MIEISFWKILLVMLVALVVLGPKHLPQAARTIGRLLSQLKNVLNSAQKELNSLTFVDKEDPSKDSSGKSEDSKP